MAFLLGILNGAFSNTGEVSFTFAQTIFYSQLGFFFSANGACTSPFLNLAVLYQVLVMV